MIMKTSKVVFATAVVAMMIGCTGSYRIEQSKRLAQTLGDVRGMFATQYVDALTAYRTDRVLAATQFNLALDVQQRQDRFAALVCDHNLHLFAVARETLGAQAQILTKATAGPSNSSMVATIKSLRAKAVSIKPPSDDGTSAEVCRMQVKTDIQFVVPKEGLAGTVAGVGALGKLVDVFGAVLANAEKEARGDRLAEILKKDEGAIWASYYLLACPRGMNKAVVPTSRPKVSEGNPLGCGSDPSAYQEMLNGVRIQLAQNSYRSFEALVAKGASLTTVQDLLRELGRYDAYREASVAEGTDAGVMVGLQVAIAKLVDAVVAGPTSSEDRLQAALDAVDNLETLLKSWSDYRSAYADYKSK